MIYKCTKNSQNKLPQKKGLLKQHPFLIQTLTLSLNNTPPRRLNKENNIWVMIIKCNKNNQNKPTPTSPLKKGLLKQHPSPHTHTLPNIKLGTRFGLYFWDFFQLDLGFFFFFSPQILKLTNLEQIIRFWTLKNNLKWSDTSINILQNSLHKYSQSIA